ncbi:RING-H2 finger protein ATL74-like [Bidens hawaiensis]|uniref:RING-H2 finger protein ATL74-like n=1 Tax=Bidens hawaiensis TaxID=980011 RepID=UPI0040498D0A
MLLEIVTAVVLLLVAIAILVIIHVCVATRTLGMTRESIGSSTVVQRSSTMSKDDINKLPWYDYKPDQEIDDDSKVKSMECAVCLDVFKNGDRCRLLPSCKHSFHANCVDSWLIKTATCPICRTCVDLGKSCGAGDICLELT